jgi:hypothetical protein
MNQETEIGTRMKQIKTAGLCLVAAFVLCAVAATSASATAPEYGRCLKKAKAEGKGYTASKCTVAGEGTKAKYEWLPGAGKTKFETNGKTGVLSQLNGQTVECKTENSEGEFFEGNNKEAGNMVIHFHGCESEGLTCTTMGDEAGELVTNDVEALVGWENKAKKKTDIELHPAKSVASGLFIEFECVKLVIKVKGAVLVPLKNDSMKTSETLKFTDTKGKQKPEKWEESSSPVILESSFEGLPYEQAGQKITSVLKEKAGEEALELNAVV